MSAVIKRIALSLTVGLCIVGLALHFAVESLGGIQDHLIGGQMQQTSHSHEGDQFVLNELWKSDSVQKRISRPFTAWLKVISRSLPPPRQPPKSI